MKLWHLFIWCVFVNAAFADSRWGKLESPTSRDLNKLCFLDSLKGWVAGDGGMVLKTTDGGSSWEFLDTKLSYDIHEIFMLNERYGWGLAYRLPSDTSWYGTIMLKTTNGGAAWTRQDYPDDFFTTITFFDTSNGLVAGDRGKIQKSSDGGMTWWPVVIDSSIFVGYPVLNVDFFSHNYGFGMGGRMDQVGVMWKTTDGGESWRTSGPGAEPIRALYFIDSLNLLAVGGDLDWGAGMVRSKNGGETWDYIYLGIWGEARALSFRTAAEGWAPLGFAGTYMVTTDTGSTWHDMFTPDSSALFDVAFIDSTHGYMVGQRGTILRYNPTTVSIKNSPVTPPTAPSLFQNFPNPFNPATTISYELTASGFVSITVYEISGKEVRKLFNGNQQAGVHEAFFDGEALASGTYYCQLETLANGQRTVQVKKMTLLK